MRYYGAYSNVVRGKQKARAALAQASTAMPAALDPPQASPQPADLPTAPKRAERRHPRSPST